MNYFRKALTDNGFELQKGMESINFVYEENKLQIVVCLKHQHFKVFDDGKEIKEGDIRELHIEYQSVTRKAFIYPVISALIDLELSGRNVESIEGLGSLESLKELSEAIGASTEDEYGVYDVLLADKVTHVYVAALNRNQAMHLAIGSNFSDSESSTFINDMSLYTCEGQELTDFIASFNDEVAVLKNVVRKKDVGQPENLILDGSWFDNDNLEKGHIVRLMKDCGMKGKKGDILKVSSLPFGNLKTLGVKNLTRGGYLDEANLSCVKMIGYLDDGKAKIQIGNMEGVNFKNPFNNEGKVFMLGNSEDIYYVYAPSWEVARSLCPHNIPMYEQLGVLSEDLWRNFGMLVELNTVELEKSFYQYIHYCIYSHDFQVLFVGGYDDEVDVKDEEEYMVCVLTQKNGRKHYSIEVDKEDLVHSVISSLDVTGLNEYQLETIPKEDYHLYSSGSRDLQDVHDEFKLAQNTGKILSVSKKFLEGVVKPKYQSLFNFFAENHNLTLTETGIEDIIGAVQKEISEVETEEPSHSDRAKEGVFMLYNSSRYQELYHSAMSAYNHRKTQIGTKYIDNDVIEKMKLFIDLVEQCDHLGKK